MKTARASYAFWTIAFLLITLPILPLLSGSLADYPNRNDARLIVWILDWVWHALWHPEASIADGPINFPAPAQLTSSDWFYTAQLTFGPLYAATANAVLATNLTAWITYPLAAVCMERLARRLGSDPLPALAAGLFFALASRRVPFNIHLLQNANFLLPMVALATLHLFDRPNLQRMLLATGAFLLACMSALYGGFFAAITGGVTLALAWLRPTDQRARATAYVAVAAAIAAATALFSLQPWIARATDELRPLAVADGSLATYGWALLGETRADPTSALTFALPIVALLAALAAYRDRTLRIGIVFGAALWLLGALLSPGYPAALESALSRTPLTFLAYPDRQQIIADLGRALLIALGLTGLRSLPLRACQPIAAAAIIILILSTRGVAYVGGTFATPPAFTTDRIAYEGLARAARTRAGPQAATGPLLELPLRLPLPPGKGTPVAPDSMLGQTLHRIPLVDGYTGYHPPHRAFALDAIGRLPSRAALEDLRRATALEWILLRPEADWRGHQPNRASILAFFRNLSEVQSIEDIGGWSLIHLQPSPPTDWSRAIARGTDRNQTVLGNPATPLSGIPTTGKLSTTALPGSGRANQFMRIDLAMRNDGTLPWPASLRSRRALMLDFGSNRPRGRFQEGTLQRVTPFPPDLSVGIAVNWQRAHGRGTTPEETGFQFLPLPRDLAPGEKIQFPAVLRYPTTVGDYTLRLELVQMVAGNPQALQIAPIEKPIQIRP